MRYYKFPFPDKEACDTNALKRDMAVAGVDVVDINLGNGALILQTPNDLTKAQRMSLDGIVSGHMPLVFKWKERGKPRSRMVSSAEDVNKITAMRIRALYNGDPIQAQIKVLTELVHQLYTSIGAATSLADLKVKSKQKTAAFTAFMSRRKIILAQGRAFKNMHSF